jgi:hypothetical protein
MIGLTTARPASGIARQSQFRAGDARLANTERRALSTASELMT